MKEMLPLLCLQASSSLHHLGSLSLPFMSHQCLSLAEPSWKSGDPGTQEGQSAATSKIKPAHRENRFEPSTTDNDFFQEDFDNLQFLSPFL